MPHIIVKLASGRSEQLKAELAEQVTKAVTTALSIDQKTVSVAIEDVDPAAWVEAVYKPDILGNMDKIYKKPGHDPL